jgi:hypothetical protein
MPKSEALRELRQIKSSYRRFVKANFETAARDCAACPTFGACCTDAHFVNVHITNLEAVAIWEKLNELPEKEKAKIKQRIAETIEKYELCESGDTFRQTFACPLFEPRIGCFVHDAGKPAACISHGCYEKSADLPPACLQANAERKIERLNQEIYGDLWCWLPLPLQLKRVDFD